MDILRPDTLPDKTPDTFPDKPDSFNFAHVRIAGQTGHYPVGVSGMSGWTGRVRLGDGCRQ